MIVLSRMFSDHRRRWIGFAVGVAAVVLVYLPLFESMQETDLLGAKLEALPDALVEALNFTDVATAAGYAQATIYGLAGMVVLVIFAIATGAWAIAGDEESGSLELTMARAVDRRRLLAERAAGLVAMVAVVAGLAGLLVAAVNAAMGLGISVAGILGGTVSLAGLALAFGAIALLVGAATGRRGLALAVTGVVAMFAYLANGILADTAAGDFFEAISPFHWAYGNDPLVNGVDGGGLALLLGLTAVCIVGALRVFDVRDVGT